VNEPPQLMAAAFDPGAFGALPPLSVQPAWSNWLPTAGLLFRYVV
jgi:hypothetical protein